MKNNFDEKDICYLTSSSSVFCIVALDYMNTSLYRQSLIDIHKLLLIRLNGHNYVRTYLLTYIIVTEKLFVEHSAIIVA